MTLLNEAGAQTRSSVNAAYKSLATDGWDHSFAQEHRQIASLVRGDTATCGLCTMDVAQR
jgi:hypothetical protein